MRINHVAEIEPGTYHGKLLRVVGTSHEEYGPGLRWDFEIDDGEHVGAVVSRTTKPVASKRNTCGAFCKMLSGLPIETAIEHDTDDWERVSGSIVIERSPSGEGIRVARFARDPSQSECAGNAPF